MRSLFPPKSRGTLGSVAAATVMKDIVADGLGWPVVMIVLSKKDQ